MVNYDCNTREVISPKYIYNFYYIKSLNISPDFIERESQFFTNKERIIWLNLDYSPEVSLDEIDPSFRVDMKNAKSIGEKASREFREVTRIIQWRGRHGNARLHPSPPELNLERSSCVPKKISGAMPPKWQLPNAGHATEPTLKLARFDLRSLARSRLMFRWFCAKMFAERQSERRRFPLIRRKLAESRRVERRSVDYRCSLEWIDFRLDSSIIWFRVIILDNINFSIIVRGRF